MREFNWGYTQFSQFNADDTLLLVSGVYIGRHHSSSGEIAVISLDDFTLLSRVRNKPYDVFGCWLNESHLISGNLHWIGNVTSCSVLPRAGRSLTLSLSSSLRYLYVNSRAWPAGCVISDPMAPPPIAEEIDLHVFDLKTLREVRRSLRAHRAFTPNDECFFIFLDVSRDFVARYLYVNSRAWPAGCVISDPMAPPPIAEEIDLHVFDLKTLREVRRSLRAHRAFTPNDECFFIFLDVSRDFVASGAEDKHGYIWDRHYNICLAKLQHDDVVNSVAFSPVDQELLLTASDDATIKVWRSPRTLRVSQASRPRPRRLLFNWLRNTKQSQSQS
ncbi:UNVERIFIED_CONTAM: hypothetical protein FKN15_046002 [Acipenser sinensis]